MERRGVRSAREEVHQRAVRQHGERGARRHVGIDVRHERGRERAGRRHRRTRAVHGVAASSDGHRHVRVRRGREDDRVREQEADRRQRDGPNDPTTARHSLRQETRHGADSEGDHEDRGGHREVEAVVVEVDVQEHAGEQHPCGRPPDDEWRQPVAFVRPTTRRQYQRRGGHGDQHRQRPADGGEVSHDEDPDYGHRADDRPASLGRPEARAVDVQRDDARGEQAPHRRVDPEPQEVSAEIVRPDQPGVERVLASDDAGDGGERRDDRLGPEEEPACGDRDGAARDEGARATERPCTPVAQAPEHARAARRRRGEGDFRLRQDGRSEEDPGSDPRDGTIAGHRTGQHRDAAGEQDRPVRRRIGVGPHEVVVAGVLAVMGKDEADQQHARRHGRGERVRGARAESIHDHRQQGGDEQVEDGERGEGRSERLERDRVQPRRERTVEPRDAAIQRASFEELPADVGLVAEVDDRVGPPSPGPAGQRHEEQRETERSPSGRRPGGVARRAGVVRIRDDVDHVLGSDVRRAIQGNACHAGPAGTTWLASDVSRCTAAAFVAERRTYTTAVPSA